MKWIVYDKIEPTPGEQVTVYQCPSCLCWVNHQHESCPNCGADMRDTEVYMSKICKNCGCFDVCIFANPCRTEDCTHGWKPDVVFCKDCLKKRIEHGYIWCLVHNEQKQEFDFCSSGEVKKHE